MLARLVTASGCDEMRRVCARCALWHAKCRLAKHLLIGGVNVVTVVARDAAALVLAAAPVRAHSRLMTRQAPRVAVGDRRRLRSLEHDAHGFARLLPMFRAGTVARLALMLRERRPRIAFDRVRRLQDQRDRLGVVAFPQTGLHAVRCVLRRRVLRRGTRCKQCQDEDADADAGRRGRRSMVQRHVCDSDFG